MTKLYAITEGSYSDYSIVGLFTSLDEVNRYLSKYPEGVGGGRDRFDVEEFEADPVKDGRAEYVVYVYPTTKFNDLKPRVSSVVKELSKTSHSKGLSPYSHWYIFAYGFSHQEAVQNAVNYYEEHAHELVPQG